MRTIWKFPLNFGVWNDVEVGMDDTATIVLTAIDPASSAPAVWIEHDPSASPVTMSFFVVGTGQEVPGSTRLEDDGMSPVEHVGSMIDGDFVWHVYQRTV